MVVAAERAGSPLADRARLRPVLARLRVRCAEIQAVRLHEPDGYECRSAESSGPSPEARRLSDRRGHGPRRSRAAGRRHRKPADDSSRRCASVENQRCVWLSSGLAAGTRACAYRSRRPSTLLAWVELPTTRCVNRQRCACESRHDFRRACRATSSDRRPARQRKHPPNFHFRSKPFLHFHNGPDRATPTSGSAGTSSRSPLTQHAER
jgi:hypothetical protein